MEIKRSNSKRTKFMTSLLDTSQEEKAVQIQVDDCESFLKVYIFSFSLIMHFQESCNNHEFSRENEGA